MVTRRALFAASLVLAMAVVGATGRAQADDAADRARAFIEALSDKAIAALTVKDISRDERAQRFRVLLNEYFAVKTIGRWVLGRYWRRASSSEQSEYLTLFEDLIVETYADRFKRYSGETLAVTKSEARSESDALVFTLMSRPNGGEPIRINWRVRSAGDKQRIVDVIVEGVSMGQTQRSEFASVIRAKGGVIKGLLEELRKRKKKAKGAA